MFHLQRMVRSSRNRLPQFRQRFRVANAWTVHESITMNTNPDPKTMNPPVKFHLANRIQEIYHELKPPVNNKLISEDFLKIMVVGGPNQRSDYHIEMGEELFYQIKGHIHLDIIHPVTRLPTRIQINEGEVFLLPRGIPHSPQRYADTVGLVIERERAMNELDCMRWYHDPSSPVTTLSPPKKSEEESQRPPRVWYEEYFYCANLGEQLKPVIHRFLDYKSNLEEAVSPPSPLTYFSNKDQLTPTEIPYIQDLNDLPYTRSIQTQPMTVLNIANMIEELTQAKALSPETRSTTVSQFDIFRSEFVFQVFTAAKGATVSFSLPEDCTSKEFLFYQFRGNSFMKKIVHNVMDRAPPVSLSHLQQEPLSCREGEMMILQDHESNLQRVEFTFPDSEGIVWCIYNTASV